MNPKICILGAGFSGICAGIKLQKELNIRDFVIYEANEDFGGIWLSHTYPGCACDVPSVMYSFSFELNPDWSTTYARQPEILQYLKNVAGKYDLYLNAKFHHRIKSSTWDEGIKKWRMVVHDTQQNRIEEVLYDIVITGVGGFGNPNIPDQFMSFQGPMVHSSRWDPNIQLENKVVGIVGSGASAVQIIPQILPSVTKLISFQRHAAWVPHQSLLARIPTVVQAAFRFIPGLLWLLRVLLFFFIELIYYPAFKTKGISADIATWAANRAIKTTISDPELRKKLTPNYRLGCKRVTPSATYLKALTNPKVEVIRQPIISVKDNSIITEDGKNHKIDILILATGYKVQDSWAPTVVYGRGSIPGEDTITANLKKGSPHYLGITMSSLPNTFMLLGPNTGYGHNSVVFSIECAMEWIIQVLREKIRRNSQVVCVKEEAEIEYRRMLNRKMKEHVWGVEKCGTWYEDEYGTNLVIFPGTLSSYWNMTRKADFSKLDFE